MKVNLRKTFVFALILGSSLVSFSNGQPTKGNKGAAAGSNKQNVVKNIADKYSTTQAVSDKAQLSTIAFSGLAFITGSSGADSFIPPGKVADFFGFQYMRDVDTAGYGHNTQFLTTAANNILKILTPEQKAKLVALAKKQAPLFTDYAYNRFPMLDAFRKELEGKTQGSGALSIDKVAEYSKNMYKIDADLSYERAVMMGEIITTLNSDQKAYLGKMEFNNFNTWPKVEEDSELKRTMSHREFVAVMTYASELFSWYKGNLEADIYFCPERHGTYFGGFFMKDYPAMNNPDYFISTSITGDKGQEFLNILNPAERKIIEDIIPAQKKDLLEIVDIRREVSTELRKAQSGGVIDKAKVYSLIGRYGELDGRMSALYAKSFAAVNKTLTSEQRAALVKLRDLDVVPTGAYLYSTPITVNSQINSSYLFGSGKLEGNLGNATAPSNFMTETRNNNPQNKGPNPNNKAPKNN